MKQTRLMKMLAAGAACSLAVTMVTAQERTTTTTTVGPEGVTKSTTTTTNLNGTGVISAYTPGSDYITFRGESGVAPARYYYTKQTTLVDPQGRAVEWSALRPDMPVNYTYVREGDRMVVTRVTLQKPIVIEKTTTTTTTTTDR